MAYMLDIAVILILLLAVYIGYRRGFVKAVIKLVGCVLAVVIASVASLPLASGIFDAFAGDKLQEVIASQMTSTDTAAVAAGIEAALDKLPGPVLNALEAYGLGTPEQIIGGVKESLDGSVEDIARSVVEVVIRPVAVALLRTLCFFLIFLLLILLVALVANLISKVFKLPILRQMDGGLGAIVGVAEGVVLVFVAVTVVQMIATSSSGDAWITNQDIHDTMLVRWVAERNPLADVLKDILRTFTSSTG